MRVAVALSAAVLTVLAGGTGLAAKEGRAAKDPAAAKLRAGTPETIPAMKVVVVRSNRPGCEPDCPVWISAEGPIGEGSADRFRAVLSKLGDARPPIVVSSPGGSVEQAFAVGRLIRKAGLTVAVGTTTLAPCGQAREPACEAGTMGAPRKGHLVGRAACSSSCAFLLAAGTRRVVGGSAFVGVHDVKTWQITRSVVREYQIRRDENGTVSRHLIAERTVASKRVPIANNDSTYRKIEVYMAEMGIGPNFLPIMRTAPNASIHWMRPAELHDTKLATETIDVTRVVGTKATTKTANGAPGALEIVTGTIAATAAPAATPVEDALGNLTGGPVDVPLVQSGP